MVFPNLDSKKANKLWKDQLSKKKDKDNDEDDD